MEALPGTWDSFGSWHTEAVATLYVLPHTAAQLLQFWVIAAEKHRTFSVGPLSGTAISSAQQPESRFGLWQHKPLRVTNAL